MRENLVVVVHFFGEHFDLAHYHSSKFFHRFSFFRPVEKLMMKMDIFFENCSVFVPTVRRRHIYAPSCVGANVLAPKRLVAGLFGSDDLAPFNLLSHG